MDAIDESLLRRAAPRWVPEVRYLEETDSTNRVAAQWAAEGADHGCLVLADYQSSGRGRRDRNWQAAPGTALLFSLVLRPTFDRASWGLVSLAAGVAVCSQLHQIGVEAALKWPNDVLIADRKVAGILSEAHRHFVVLGVGINVADPQVDSSLGVKVAWVSEACGHEVSRLEVLSGVLTEFERAFASIPGDLVPTYRALCSTLGARVRLTCSEKTIESVAIDVDGNGSLILAGGRVVEAADIEHLRPS